MGTSPTALTTASPSSAPTYAGSDWSSTALGVEDRLGERFTYHCPPDGRAGVVWGTDTYTADSSVCTAAVHAGLISLAAGGDVVIEVRPGEAAYTGSDRNGVSTLGYGSYDSSFVPIGGQVAPGGPTATAGATPSSQGGDYAELLTHLHPTIANTCTEVDPTEAGARAVANCQPEDVVVDPDVVIGDVVYVWYDTAGEAGDRFLLEVERHGDPDGDDCASGPSHSLYQLDGEIHGRLLCAEDVTYGGTVIAWWLDQRLNVTASLLLYEGTFADLADLLEVFAIRP